MSVYVLMNKDRPIAELCCINRKFVITRVLDNIPTFIGEVDEWVSSRLSPIGRWNIQRLLKLAQIKDQVEYVDISKAISFTDTLWVNNTDIPTTWDKISPYRNRLSNIISRVALDFEYTGGKLRSPSPDYTVDGSVDKCWKRVDGKIYLYKSDGECWSDKAGKRPYCEYYAQQVAEALGIPDYVKYTMNFGKTNDGFIKPYVICEAFTDERTGYIPLGRTKLDRLELPQLFNMLDARSQQNFRGMIILDSIIMNVDRHDGNFGFLINNDNFKIKGLAPIYDNDCSLGSLMSIQDKTIEESYQELRKFHPKTELGGFIPQARKFMNKYYADKIRQMHPFKFKRLPKDVDVSDKRMAFMEYIVNSQIRAIFARD